MSTKEPDEVMREIRATMCVGIARASGINKAAVYQWRQVPIYRVHEVAKMIGKRPDEIFVECFHAPSRRRQPVDTGSSSVGRSPDLPFLRWFEPFLRVRNPSHR